MKVIPYNGTDDGASGGQVRGGMPRCGKCTQPTTAAKWMRSPGLRSRQSLHLGRHSSSESSRKQVDAAGEAVQCAGHKGQVPKRRGGKYFRGGGMD
jgi:hypothetical protein